MLTPPQFDGSRIGLVRAVGLAGVLPAVVVGVLAAVFVGWLVGLVAAIVIAGGWLVAVAWRVRGALDRTLAASSGTRLTSGARPRWENIVEGLCVSNGVQIPELWLVESPGANALAAVDRDRVALVASGTLLDSMTVVELEAVTANLVGRVKDGSARYGTVAFGLFGSMLGGSGGPARVLARGLGEQRAIASDLQAVDMTRYPPGLASAFVRLESIGTAIDGVAPSTAHLWIAPVVGADAVAPDVARTALQPLTLRIAVLDEL